MANCINHYTTEQVEILKKELACEHVSKDSLLFATMQTYGVDKLYVQLFIGSLGE